VPAAWLKARGLATPRTELTERNVTVLFGETYLPNEAEIRACHPPPGCKLAFHLNPNGAGR
jgi:hypothetical protein